MTTVREALEAVARGEPTAMRKAVEALGETLDLLADQGADMGEKAPSAGYEEQAR
jgi:hypothetical protein